MISVPQLFIIPFLVLMLTEGAQGFAAKYHSVLLTGTHNNWEPSEPLDMRADFTWQGTADLKASDELRFVVDGCNTLSLGDKNSDGIAEIGSYPSIKPHEGDGRYLIRFFGLTFDYSLEKLEEAPTNTYKTK